MTPKQAYFALNGLIHDEWKTRTSVRAGKGGEVSFRGFRGSYELSWEDVSGKKHSATVKLD
ncbi:hypothetical protein SDC9_180152 [bioreactor metagenome]|uniref:Uncharacterized protein n=1 Tax=bioreactor metagenome TaxID=1076179 RepID=A0A645H2Y8_9ZZZZ